MGSGLLKFTNWLGNGATRASCDVPRATLYREQSRRDKEGMRNVGS